MREEHDNDEDEGKRMWVELLCAVLPKIVTPMITHLAAAGAAQTHALTDSSSSSSPLTLTLTYALLLI
jgi:hypothetical protein